VACTSPDSRPTVVLGTTAEVSIELEDPTVF